MARSCRLTHGSKTLTDDVQIDIMFGISFIYFKIYFIAGPIHFDLAFTSWVFLRGHVVDFTA